MIKDLLKDIGKYLPSQIVPGLAGLVLLPIITRLFPPEDYGNYVLVRYMLTIMGTLTVGWLAAAIIRLHSVYSVNNTLHEFVGAMILLAAVVIAAVTALGVSVLLVMGAGGSSEVLVLIRVGLAVFVSESVFRILTAYLRAERRVGWYSATMAWVNIARLGLGILLVTTFGFGVEGLLWGTLLAIAVIIPVVWRVAIGRFLPRGWTFRSALPIFRKAAGYGLPLIVVQLASLVIMLSDRYVIAWFRDSTEVGIYSAGYIIPQQTVHIIGTMFVMASGPILYKIWDKDGPSVAGGLISRLTRYYLLLAIPAAVGLTVLARDIMRVLTGPEYQAGYRVVPWVAWSVFLIGITNRFSVVLTCAKRTRVIMYCNLFCAALNVGLNMIFVPLFGYVAAAVTTLVSFAVDLALKVTISRRYLTWRYPFGSLARISVAGAAMGGVVYLLGRTLPMSPLVTVLLAIVAGAVVYGGMLLAVGEFRPEEIQGVRRVVGRILRVGRRGAS